MRSIYSQVTMWPRSYFHNTHIHSFFFFQMHILVSYIIQALFLSKKFILYLTDPQGSILESVACSVLFSQPTKPPNLSVD